MALVASCFADNLGNYPTRPTVSIFGPCVNPVVTNFTTGEIMQCIISLVSGDELDIDFDARTILLNGQSRYSTKTTASTWWEIAPITVEIHFNANAFVSGSSMIAPNLAFRMDAIRRLNGRP